MKITTKKNHIILEGRNGMDEPAMFRFAISAFSSFSYNNKYNFLVLNIQGVEYGMQCSRAELVTLQKLLRRG